MVAAGSTDLVGAAPFENQCELLGAAVEPEHGFTDLVVLAAGSTDLVGATPFENQCELLGVAVEPEHGFGGTR